MKLGLNIGYTGAQVDMPVKRILRAEELGFDTLWTSEAYGTDALTPLAYVAALTKRIKLGTGVAQLAARSPAALAMAAQTLDALAGGDRVILGIGVSGPQIVEGWYGQPWGKPNIRLRDYVAIIRKVFERKEPVSHDGREIALPYTGPGASGLGKPLKSILHTNPRIPIVLGTTTPLNIRMTGEIADGWLSLQAVPASIAKYREILQEGLAKRADGRTMQDFMVQGWVGIKVTPDVKQAIDALKPAIAVYVGGMGAREKNFHKDNMIERGYPEAAERIQELFLAGRKAEAAAAVPDEFVDEGALVGPEARIRERWKPWADAAFDSVMLNGADDEAIEVMGRIMRAG